MSRDLEQLIFALNRASLWDGAKISKQDFSVEEIRKALSELREIIQKAKNHGQ